jgi:hypothetical protein
MIQHIRKIDFMTIEATLSLGMSCIPQADKPIVGFYWPPSKLAIQQMWLNRQAGAKL